MKGFPDLFDHKTVLFCKTRISNLNSNAPWKPVSEILEQTLGICKLTIFRVSNWSEDIPLP